MRLIWILVVGIVLVSGCIEETQPDTTQLTFQELCGPSLALHRSTDFLSRYDLVEVVGTYDPDTIEITNYDPQLCFQWMGSRQCHTLYTEGASLKRSLCSDHVKYRAFPDVGRYRVDKSCCLQDGDCSIIEGSYLADELCSVIVEGPKTEKACYKPINVTLPLQYTKTVPFQNLTTGDYVYANGYFYPPDLPAEDASFFEISVQIYRKLKLKVNSAQAVDICKNSILQNRKQIEDYCSANDFSCYINQSLETDSSLAGITKLSVEEKWIVGIPMGGKVLPDGDTHLDFRLFCIIDPYSGDLLNSTACSRGSCIICEP